MPSDAPRPSPWTKTNACVIIFFTGAVAGLFALSWGVSQDPPEFRKKYFGLGRGPAFLHTWHTSGLDLNKGLYEEYFGFKKLTKSINEQETEYYKKY